MSTPSYSSFETGAYSLSATVAPAWTDGFEPYEVGSFPDSNWIADANAADTSTNYVDGAVSWEGSKSLRLHGAIGGCWGAIAYRDLTIAPPFEIEVTVRNGNETLSGCHPQRATLALRKGASWENPGRRLLSFLGTGGITSASGSVLLEGYDTLRWYRVRIRYEWISEDEVRISYWIDGEYKGAETLAAHEEEAQMTNVGLAAQEGTAWFDDVVVMDGTVP